MRPVGVCDLDARVVAAHVEEAADAARALGIAEALLLASRCDAAELSLYVWRPAGAAVVLGSAGRLACEVCEAGCARRAVPVFRRVSGGGTVLLGPQTWCYSAVWSRGLDPGTIQAAFAWLLARVSAVLGRMGVEAAAVPLSDLAVAAAGSAGLRKIAGHSQKRTRHGVLCEGTLCAAPFPFAMSEVLAHPPREPPYRGGRTHEAFMTSLAAQGAAPDFALFARLLLQELNIPHAAAIPAHVEARARELAATRHATPEWARRL